METSLIIPDEHGWVNARNLHRALGAKTQYADWVKRRLLDNKAQNGSDYTCYQSSEKANRRRGANTRNEYLVTAFMAEHFAMMEQTPQSKLVRDFYIQCRRAAEGMAHEIAKLRAENQTLKAPKKRRLTNGRVLETITNIIETRDMFGNVTVEKRIEKKYRDEMSETERRLAALQHCARVQDGLAKRIKKEACGDNVVPIKKALKARA